MAKHRYGFDEQKIERFIKEGRGQGQGAEYLPWLTIHDVPSHGRRSRPFSLKTGRVHHLMSDVETSVFLLSDWNRSVLDIREQFPLDRARTRLLAAELGVKHPQDVRTKTDLVMTVDLLLDVLGDSQPRSIPVSCKFTSDLTDRRTLEKLEIERRYCIERWGAWRLMTERDYDEAYVGNLCWVHEMASIEKQEAPHPSYWQDCCRHLVHALRSSPSRTLQGAFKAMEQSQGLPEGTALLVFRHLLATRAVGMDLRSPFRDDLPSSALTFAASASEVRSAA
jgi:hypothetical protein